MYKYIYKKKLNGSHQTRNISQLREVGLVWDWGWGILKTACSLKKKTVCSLIYKVCFPFIYYKEHMFFVVVVVFVKKNEIRPYFLLQGAHEAGLYCPPRCAPVSATRPPCCMSLFVLLHLHL